MKVTCVFCGNNVEVPITEEQYERIVNRDDLIQNIVPELSPEYREMFILYLGCVQIVGMKCFHKIN